jgi:hypothetical protein
MVPGRSYYSLVNVHVHLASWSGPPLHRSCHCMHSWMPLSSKLCLWIVALKLAQTAEYQLCCQCLTFLCDCSHRSRIRFLIDYVIPDIVVSLSIQVLKNSRSMLQFQRSSVGSPRRSRQPLAGFVAVITQYRHRCFMGAYFLPNLHLWRPQSLCVIAFVFHCHRDLRG